MKPMSDLFIQHLREIGWRDDALRVPLGILNAADRDMEHMIDELDKLRNGFRSQLALGLQCDEMLLRTLEALIREAEWFVQHLCEQLRQQEASAAWRPFFDALQMKAGAVEATIVTSNYDRAIEIGARAAGVQLDDGFSSAQHEEAARWVDFSDSSTYKLLKVHGSTDWYQSSEGRPIKLKHAIPVFGSLRLHASDDAVLSAALVLPSREKKVTTPPYPTISAAMHLHARRATAAVFVGTSLRDPHLRVLFEECAERIPTAYVSRAQPPWNLGRARHVSQSASYFLSSTMPRLVYQVSNPVEAIDRAADLTQHASVINAVLGAWDSSRSDRERCACIEKLLEMRFAARTDRVAALVRDDSPAVRRFALGLVRDAYGPDDLVELARVVAAERADAELVSELAVLESLLRPA